MATNTKAVELELSELERQLRPDNPNLELYECGGQTVFSIYAASGGLAVQYICYWIIRGAHPLDGGDMGRGGVGTIGNGDKRPWLRCGIEVNPFLPKDEAMQDIRVQVNGFIEWAKSVEGQEKPEEVRDIKGWLADRAAATKETPNVPIS